MKQTFDGTSWAYTTAANLKGKTIANPGISFIGMTQLETLFPKMLNKMIQKGGGFLDRVLLIVNPIPSRLYPTEKSAKLEELRAYPERNLQ